MTVEGVALRAAVGDANFEYVEAIAAALERLKSAGVISDDGLLSIIEAIAEEIVTEALARDAATATCPPAAS